MARLFDALLWLECLSCLALSAAHEHGDGLDGLVCEEAEAAAECAGLDSLYDASFLQTSLALANALHSATEPQLTGPAVATRGTASGATQLTSDSGSLAAHSNKVRDAKIVTAGRLGGGGNLNSTNQFKTGSHTKIIGKGFDMVFEYVGILTFIALLIFGGAAGVSGLMADERTIEMLHEVREERDNLKDEVDDMVTDIGSMLGDILKSSALLAHNSFEDKRKDLRRFLKRVAESPKHYETPSIQESFKKLLCHWLYVLEDCCVNPLTTTPNRLLEPEQVERCQSCKEAAELVIGSLESMNLKLDTKALDSTIRRPGGKRSSMGAAPTEQPGKTDSGGIGFSLHQEHPCRCCPPVSLVISLLLGIAFFVFCQQMGRSEVGYCGLAVALLGWYAYRTIQHELLLAELQTEVEDLHRDMKEAHQQREELKGMHEQFRHVSILWLHRTVPWLDVLHEVQARCLDCHPSQREDFMQRCCAQLDDLKRMLGPLDIWCGPTALSDAQLQVVASQLKVDPEGKQMALTKSMRAHLDSWVADEEVSQCAACKHDFSVTTRRHHCRRCGKVFCNSCSSRSIPLPDRGYLEAVRVCDSCSGFVRHESATTCHACNKRFGMLHAKHSCNRCGQVFCDSCSSHSIPVLEKGYTDPVRVCNACSGWADASKATSCAACGKSIAGFHRRQNCYRCGEVFCKNCRKAEAPIPKLGYTKAAPVCQACLLKLEKEELDEKAEKDRVEAVPQLLRCVSPLGFLRVRMKAGSNLPALNTLTPAGLITTDSHPYVLVGVEQRDKSRTKTFWKSLHPTWDEEFFFGVSPSDRYLSLEVYNDDPHGREHALIGRVDLNIRGYAAGETHVIEKGLQRADRGTLEFELSFWEDVQQLALAARASSQ
eukprot:TRINITY_DN46851_c0_g1_i2.p1 TRINITY_DN46851_c0_g1~~TRINITY_DN46851_c0_g1_i2.p1  ORF type:complete len:905 (-),score=136.85 TRINITY_DN46851_c0_g1_i2:214-2859(-)